jgi:CHASE2 domain-containing sensor protein
MPGLDRHDTVVGDMPGYMLQANYLESLLDDRLIRPVPEAVDWISGFVVYAAFEFIIRRYHRRRVPGVLWALVLLSGTALTVYLAVTLFGYYLNPATVSLLAALMGLMDLVLWPSEVANMRART